KRIQYSANEYTEYQYDAAGNRTYERNYHKDTSLGIDIDTITRVSYDSHNRVSRVTTDDMANGGIRTLDIEYGYDAVGNRRRVVAYSGYGPGVAPIAVANEAPISRANPPAVNLRHGEPVEWRWHPGDYFNDPEGAELSFTVTQGASGALPSWLSYRRDEATGEWVFSYNGAGTVGQTASIRIKATDPDGAVATATFSANVVSANTKPSLVGASSLSYTIKTGVPFGKEFLASELFRDPDVGDSMQLSIVGTPPTWLNAVNNGDMIMISGQPGSGHVGVSTFKVRATDSYGSYRDLTVTLDVKAPAAPAPQLVPAQIGYANQAFSFERTFDQLFVDAHGDDFTIQVDMANGSALPVWLKAEIEDLG